MIKTFIGIAVGLFTGLSVYALANEKIYRRLRFIQPAKEGEAEISKEFSKRERVCIFAVIAAIIGAAACKALFTVSDITVILRIVSALYFVSLCAVTDIKEHRIPNILTALLASCEIIMLLIDWIAGKPEALAYTFSAVFSCLVTVLLLSVASFLSKGGLGLGDIKLLAALSLFGSVYLIGSAVIISMLCCSAAGVILLVIKKRSVKDGLPYGPFLLIGLVAAVLMNLY